MKREKNDDKKTRLLAGFFKKVSLLGVFNYLQRYLYLLSKARFHHGYKVINSF